MSTIRVLAKALRIEATHHPRYYDGEAIEVLQSFEKGDGKYPVAMGALVTSEGEYIQFSDYGVLDGVGHKHHKKKDEDDD